MERDFAGVRVTRAAYRRLAKVCQSDTRFPSSYRAMVTLVANGTEQALNEGRRFDELTLDDQDFVAWCRRLEVHPSFDALRAYLILRRGGDDVLPGRAGPAIDSLGTPTAGTPSSEASKRIAELRLTVLRMLQGAPMSVWIRVPRA